jgi:hypothetical protein
MYFFSEWIVASNVVYTSVYVSFSLLHGMTPSTTQHSSQGFSAGERILPSSPHGATEKQKTNPDDIYIVPQIGLYTRQSSPV